MIEIRELDLATASSDDIGRLLRRSAVPDAAVRKGAADIVDAVRRGGDAALRDAGERFGGGRADGQLAIPSEELAGALARLDSPTDMVREIARRVDAQPGSLHQTDDLTLICLRAGSLDESRPGDAGLSLVNTLRS